ncbi:MAG: alpha-N-arabinofuranosidase [Spirochaetaceae bacterium]|nr:alpha-N-arabinofuranosidase [Spirochaetaceae bacterium]
MEAKLLIDVMHKVGPIDDRLYGSFIEHLGRAVYGGIYQPGQGTADDEGFRRDVLDLVRDLRVPIVRYPGGNFVSAYDWEDGVGPRDKRPTRLDLAWKTVETNEMGLNEFARWAKKADSDVMMALNLGTRGLEAAKNLVEYCNHPGGTYWSDLRRSHGIADPYGFKVWCLGNEMDGPWQTGHKTADEYGRLAAECARAIRQFDDSLELVACGSSTGEMPTFPDWEAAVLDHTYEFVDYISLHTYFKNLDDDLPSFLAKSVGMDNFIRTVVGTADYVKAKKRSKKTMMLSFDEWNVWYHSEEADSKQEPWTVSPPLLEDLYNFEDALVTGCMINSLIRNADRVKMACLAQLVNVIAPIMTSDTGCWPQATYWPFYYASRYGRGVSLGVECDSPAYEDPDLGAIPYLDVTATHDEEAGRAVLFIVNRSMDEPVDIDVRLGGFSAKGIEKQVLMTSEDPKAVNDEAYPNRVRAVNTDIFRLAGERISGALPPLSWSMVSVALR